MVMEEINVLPQRNIKPLPSHMMDASLQTEPCQLLK
jgi:hypothetical protein